MDQRRFLTEFDGDDGARYAGPIVLADCLPAAQAIVRTCLQGPTGQPITVLGELVATELGPPESFATVRLVSS